MRISGHREPQSTSGRSKPSVRVAKNHSPMTRRIAPTISEAFRPLSDAGGRQVGTGAAGGGALAPHEAGDDGGGSVGGGEDDGATDDGAVVGAWSDPGSPGGSIGVRVVSESVMGLLAWPFAAIAGARLRAHPTRCGRVGAIGRAADRRR